MTKKRIDREVSVTSVFFRSASLETWPRRIEYDGMSYTFTDGLRLNIRRGDRLTRLFEMTDGESQFRLRHDDEGWRLLAIG